MTHQDSVPEPLSAAEIDRRLDQAVRDHERAEKLICLYLSQMAGGGHYTAFGFENIYDYALERFGFCRSKTRALLYLGRRLARLPRLTQALAEGRLGWTKAAKVASVATPETEGDWTERAVASSYRELERTIRDGVAANGGRVSIYLTREQAAVWSRALELCRRVSGEEVDAGLALEYIAGEFLATYQASSSPPTRRAPRTSRKRTRRAPARTRSSPAGRRPCVPRTTKARTRYRSCPRDRTRSRIGRSSSGTATAVSTRGAR